MPADVVTKADVGAPGVLDPPPGASAACLVFRNVNVRAGDTQIIHDLTLSIGRGAPTVIMGPNGSGKTTLLKLAMGLTAATSGRVDAAPELKRSFVFQRPVMLRRSAAENIAFARAAAGLGGDAGVISRLLDLVGLAHLADRPARKLSGGEQQRLALARALAREPGILFLDEPTASLDPAATKMIEDAIARITADAVKVVLATHDLGQARRLAGDVIFLVNGQLVERAPGPDFFHRPGTEAARHFLAGDLIL